MSSTDTGPAVQLAVVVRSSSGLPARPGQMVGVHDQQARLVRALLSSASGREIAGSDCDAALVFDGPADAVEAAVTLVSRLDRMPVELRGVDLGIGLDVVASTDPVASDVVTRIAESAQDGRIRLGPALAGIVSADPPDHLVVRSLDRRVQGVSGPIHVLVSAADEIPNNLAPTPTSIIGREDDIGEVRRLIQAHRIVTLIGMPGSGKSRLAAEVASRVLGRFADGVWIVAFAPVRDTRLVMSTVATALGVAVPPGRSALDVVTAHVRDRQVLIVLDDFEHLVSVAPEIDGVVAASARARWLVTSRTPLHLEEEHDFVVAPLAIPEVDWRLGRTPSPSMDLFVERATASYPGFRLGEADVATLVELCRRLDGLPLAIELAASRVKSLSVRSIIERLDERIVPSGEGVPADAPRHGSLSAAIEWSYDLLGPSGQRLLRRLSVFRGGWSVGAAAAMTEVEPPIDDTPLDVLAVLLDAHLVTRQLDESDEPRFTMASAVRAYAGQRLDASGESVDTLRRQASHVLEIATRIGPDLMGPRQTEGLDRLALEHDNIRAALAFLIRSDPVDALRLVSGVWRFWQMRGHLAEGSRWVDEALQTVGGDGPADVMAGALTAAGGLAYWRGDLEATEQAYERVVALRRSTADDVGVAEALFDLAFVFDPALRPPPEDPTRTAVGIGLAEEARELFVRAGNLHGIARSEWLLGSLVANRDIDRAMSLLASSVDRFRELGDPFGLGWALHSYGLVLLRSVDADSARAAFSEALGLFDAVGDGSAIALLLEDFAEVAAADGDALGSARLRGAAAGARRSTEADLAVANAMWQLGDALPRGLIDPAALERAWAEGKAMTQAEAIESALRGGLTSTPGRGLRVSALGSLVVESGGRPVSDWGGPKAGSRHALAIFAFLMDRGERGVTKDEFIEVLWPDADVGQGDLNFHRTLGGLRSRLASVAERPATPAETVVFSNGRYRLGGDIVGWLDIAEFQQRLVSAVEATDAMSAIRALESARALYRGDYLDDCPLYGDSAFVEERRRSLRGRLVDALVDLGRRYEVRHEESLASARFREALAVAGGDCPSAVEGLKRLGVATT
jgi:predicted ATPase/DNA-binding SARP family transcriptional activator